MTKIIPEQAREFAVSVVEQLQQAGYQALWAGGCVRDKFLGIEPKDYDVATNAVPDQIQEVFGRRKTLAIGASFGVIKVLGPSSAGQIDVATFRQDAQYSDGRHPDHVTFTSAEEDASRRDFTINGMFFDPLKDEVIDYVSGQTDLQRKVIRAIGDPQLRFSEDKLRILRAVRFAATFGFEIEAETRAAIEQFADQLQVVSAERITAEMERMLTHKNRHLAVQLLQQCGLLAIIFPEGNYDSHDYADRLEVALKGLAALKTSDFATSMAFLWSQLATHPSRDETETMTRRLKLSNPQIKSILWMLEQEPQIVAANEIKWPTLQRILIDPRIECLLDLATARRQAEQKSILGIEHCRQKLQLPAAKLNPPQLINGTDLQELGLSSGPLFREILTQVRDAQLLGEFNDKATAIQWVQDRWPS